MLYKRRRPFKRRRTRRVRRRRVFRRRSVFRRRLRQVAKGVETKWSYRALDAVNIPNAATTLSFVELTDLDQGLSAAGKESSSIRIGNKILVTGIRIKGVVVMGIASGDNTPTYNLNGVTVRIMLVRSRSFATSVADQPTFAKLFFNSGADYSTRVFQPIAHSFAFSRSYQILWDRTLTLKQGGFFTGDAPVNPTYYWLGSRSVGKFSCYKSFKRGLPVVYEDGVGDHGMMGNLFLCWFSNTDSTSASYQPILYAYTSVSFIDP